MATGSHFRSTVDRTHGCVCPMASGTRAGELDGLDLPRVAVTRLALDFLTALEQREMRLLAWGYVDNAWTPDEVADLADEFVLGHDETGVVSGADLIAELRARALLLAVDG